MKVRWMVAMACVAGLGCGDDDHDHDEADEEEADVGTATGAVCDSTLTYEADIAPFAAKYCTSCHATALTGTARQGAPGDHNFETEDGILEEKAHVDEEAGSGPSATNTAMPPAGSPAPTKAEREKLSAWLACQN